MDPYQAKRVSLAPPTLEDIDWEIQEAAASDFVTSDKSSKKI